MTLRVTIPLYAACAKGSIIPDTRLTKRPTGSFITATKWHTSAGGWPAGPSAQLLAIRAKVQSTQALYRLDSSTNGLQQSSRRSIPGAGTRITLYAGTTRTEWGQITGTRQLYLAGHPTPLHINHASPCV